MIARLVVLTHGCCDLLVHLGTLIHTVLAQLLPALQQIQVPLTQQVAQATHLLLFVAEDPIE